MLYLVSMQVNLPASLAPEAIEGLKADERARSQELQRAGKMRHLWRVAGQYANVSVFDVDNHDELHTLLSSLPLFAFMKIEVTPLARHPNAIAAN